MPLKPPTPPTPPTIDKGEMPQSTPRIDAHQFFEIPFKREDIPAKPPETPVETPPPQVERKVTTPEDMARDAVANGAGALTKRTVTRPDAESNSPATAPPATTPAVTAPSSTNRGREILREFQKEDTSQTAEVPRTVNLHQSENHGGFYWIGILVFVAVLSVVFVKKFLIRTNPQLKKSDLFEDADKRLQAVSEKVTASQAAAKVQPKKAPPKIDDAKKVPEKVPTKKPPPKTDDGKGKHFEARV